MSDLANLTIVRYLLGIGASGGGNDLEALLPELARRVAISGITINSAGGFVFPTTSVFPTFVAFGGLTSAFPAFKRVGAGIQTRLADDSADAELACNNITVATNGGIYSLGRGSLTFTADGQIRLLNQAATGFNTLMFGGLTSAFVGFRLTGTRLECILADASAFAAFKALSYICSNGSTLADLSDGVFKLSNAAATAGISLDVSADAIAKFRNRANNADADVTLNNLSLLGGQLTFPATQVPSAGANVLDDYEEGSWTPVIGGAGGTSGQTYSTQSGRYIKIGRFVFLKATVTLSNKGTITGGVELQGFPFQIANETANGSFTMEYFSGMNTAVIHILGYANANLFSATVWYLAAAATAPTQMVTGDVTNTTRFDFSVSYTATA